MPRWPRGALIACRRQIDGYGGIGTVGPDGAFASIQVNCPQDVVSICYPANRRTVRHFDRGSQISNCRLGFWFRSRCALVPWSELDRGHDIGSGVVDRLPIARSLGLFAGKIFKRRTTCPAEACKNGLIREFGSTMRAGSHREEGLIGCFLLAVVLTRFPGVHITILRRSAPLGKSFSCALRLLLSPLAEAIGQEDRAQDRRAPSSRRV